MVLKRFKSLDFFDQEQFQRQGGPPPMQCVDAWNRHRESSPPAPAEPDAGAEAWGSVRAGAQVRGEARRGAVRWSAMFPRLGTHVV